MAKKRKKTCWVCGELTEDDHHFWVDNFFRRKKEDGLKVPVCRYPCHRGFHVFLKENECPANCFQSCKYDDICCWSYMERLDEPSRGVKHGVQCR